MAKKGSPKQATSAPFAGVGESTGTKVWRIEDMKPVPVSAAHHGLFYSGDSYLVLHTEKSGAAKTYELHFWLGAKTSQDESGAEAIFATELDDKLGGKAKQYRQVQEGESPEFLRLFKGGLQYLEGGVKSGFRHVEKDQAPLPSLLQIKDTEDMRVAEVELATSSLNSGDIFILDLFDTITLWAGKDASVQEKAKARVILEGMREKRKGQTQVTFLEESDESDANHSFYSALGATDVKNVTIAPATADQATTKPAQKEPPTLYKLSGGSAGANSVSIAEVGKAPLSRSQLDVSSVHALHAGGRLFLWQCKGAHSAGSQADVGLAGRVLTQLRLPLATPVQIIKEGEEDETFKQHFNWAGPATTATSTPATPRASNGAKTPQKAAGEQTPEATTSVSTPATSPASNEAKTPQKVAGKQTPEASLTPSSSKGSPAVAATPPVATASPSVEGSAVKPSSADGPGKSVTSGNATPAASPASSAATEGKKVPTPSSPGQSPIPALATPESTGSKKAARFPIQPSPSAEIVKGGPEPRKPIRKLKLDSIWQNPAQANGDAQKPLSPKDAVFIMKPKVYEPSGPPRPVADVKIAPGSQTFSYEDLRVMRVESGIDITKKEEYMSAGDFEKVFGKSPADFKALAKWKQLGAKKDKGLF